MKDKLIRAVNFAVYHRIINDDVIIFLDSVIYWTIILIPFSMAIAPAPMNVFMGFLLGSFLVKKIIKKESIFKKTSINTTLLFFLLIICLSAINSASYKDSLIGGILRLLHYIFIVFIMTEYVRDKKHIWIVVLSMCMGIIFTYLDGIWQIFTGKDFVRGYAPVINRGLVRATASFKDSNVLGIYLSAIAPLIFGLTLYYLKGIKKLIFVLISLIALVGIALTYSRPTLLAIYVALFFLGIARKDKLLIGSLIILTLASPFILPESVKNWAKEVDYSPLRFMCNDDRIAIYRNSFNMIRHHPIIGVGANTFMRNYKFYKESPEYRNVVTSDYVYAHNNFIHMVAETGLVGLGIFIWLLYRLFKEFRSIYKKLDDDFLKIVLLSSSGCLIAFLVNGLTESSLYYSRVAVIFWYLTGLSLSLNKFTLPFLIERETAK